MNLYLNQFLSQYDEVTKKEEDYWATPKEFIANGYGDCEDYAIIKYFTLIKLGFKKDKLFFTIVYEKYSKGYHMVLSYFKDKDKSPLVLDNLSFRILPLSKRDDLKADFFLNEYGVYKMHRVNKRYELVKVKKQSSKFQKLLNKIEKEN